MIPVPSGEGTALIPLQTFFLYHIHTPTLVLVSRSKKEEKFRNAPLEIPNRHTFQILLYDFSFRTLARPPGGSPGRSVFCRASTL
jgi:hypothetical protein